MAFTDDDQAFVKILKSMGIEEFDPLVPVALNEYAARKSPWLFVFVMHGLLELITSRLQQDLHQKSYKMQKTIQFMQEDWYNLVAFQIGSIF